MRWEKEWCLIPDEAAMMSSFESNMLMYFIKGRGIKEGKKRKINQEKNREDGKENKLGERKTITIKN